MNEKKKTGTAVRIVLPVLVILLAAAGITAILVRLNVLPAPPFLNGLFSFREKVPAEQDAVPEGIPELHASDGELTEIFYDVDPSQLLNTLSVWDSYTLNIRVIESYNSDYTIERYRLAKSGANWRADSDDRRIIWNGERLYVREEPNAWYFEAGSFDFFEEIGITPLEKIREDAAEMGFEYRLSDDGKLLSIVITDKESGVRSEYEIAVETGVVLSEISYYGNTPFRTVVTDSMNLSGADALPDDYFDLP